MCVWDLNSNLSTIGVKGTVMDQTQSLLNGHSAEIQDVKFKPGDDIVRLKIFQIIKYLIIFNSF